MCSFVSPFAERYPIAALLLENARPRPFSYLTPESVLKGISPDEIDVLYLYGVEKARAAEGWNKKLILLEHDVSKLKVFLEQPQAEAYFRGNEQRVVWVAGEMTYCELVWGHLFLRTYHRGIPALERWENDVHLAASDYADFGKGALKNILENLSDPTVFKASASFSSCTGVPAIVCGSGPSLERHWEALAKSNALIIACGSAMILLANRRIPFHCGVFVDPKTPDRGEWPKNTPLFFLGRASSSFVSSFEGPKFLLPAPGGYPIEGHLLDDDATLDAGWTAGSCGVQLAMQLGCSPIYTAGIDGGRVEGVRYAGDELEQEGPEADLIATAEWIEENAPCRSYNGEVFPIRRIPLFDELPIGKIDRSEVCESFERCADALERWVNGKDERERLLARFDAEDEAAARFHLDPVWQIWQHAMNRDSPFDRETTKLLFYRTALQELLPVVREHKGAFSRVIE